MIGSGATTYLGASSYERFDPDSESNFNDDINGDEDIDDKNM